MPTTTLDPSDVLVAFLSWDEITRRLRSGTADPAVRRRALAHPEARARREAFALCASDVDVMTLAAIDHHNEVRQVAARSHATPPEVLATLVDDRSRVVRELLARNAHTPVDTVERLAFDPATEVRHCVCDRPLSLAALEHLAGDLSVDIRERIARRPDLPHHLCMALAADPHSPVRVRIAERAAPQAVHDTLAHDPSPDVVRAVATNPAIGRHVALTLAGHAEPTVRAAVGRTTRDPEVLDVLADDSEMAVRAVVATNPALATSTAARMLDTQSGLLKRTVLTRHHEQLPEDLVQRVLDELLAMPQSQTRMALRRQFADRIRPREITSPPALDDRRGLFEVVDQWLPFALIADAVMHPSVPVTVRAALLEHPEVPTRVRAELRHHPHRLIRQAATNTNPRRRLP